MRHVTLCRGMVMLAALCVLPGPSVAMSDIVVAQPGPSRCLLLPEAAVRASQMRINGLRVQSRLPRVRADDRLMQAAAHHACESAARGVMTHVGANGSTISQRVLDRGYRFSIIAENVAAGHIDLDWALSSWERSPGHRANTLHPAVSEFGIGGAVSADGRRQFWAVVFGSPQRR